MLNEIEIAGQLIAYSDELEKKYESKKFDNDHAMITGIVLGLLTALGRANDKEEIKKIKNDLFEYVLEVVEEIIRNHPDELKQMDKMSLQNC